MSIIITETHEDSGGHTWFEFEINPNDSGLQSEIFRQGMQIEEDLTRSELLDKSEHLAK